LTTMSAAMAAVEGIQALKLGAGGVKSLQDYFLDTSAASEMSSAL
jgi:hypothetical protein